MTVFILNFSILLGLPQLLLQFGNISFDLKLKEKKTPPSKYGFMMTSRQVRYVSLVRHSELPLIGLGLARSS